MTKYFGKFKDSTYYMPALVEVDKRTLSQLPEIVDSLSGEDQEVFENTMAVTVGVARIYSKTINLDGLSEQKIFTVRNKFEHLVDRINEARALRPQGTVDCGNLEARIEEERGRDPFCPENFETKTPEHSFGRIKGVTCVTAANLYPASPWHAVIIFNEHNPFAAPTRAQVLDRFYVSDEFARAANKADENAIYTSYMQNNLDPAGASIYHGHAQTQQLIGFHDGLMEAFYDIHHKYIQKYGRDYFPDLFRAHKAVGLAIEKNGVMIISSLTALKERSIRMIAYSFDDPQREVFADILHYFMDESGFSEKAFNFGAVFRPIAYDGRDWNRFPAVIGEIVSRGDINKRNNSVAASEFILRSPVVAMDPYRVYDGIVKALTV